MNYGLTGATGWTGWIKSSGRCKRCGTKKPGILVNLPIKKHVHASPDRLIANPFLKVDLVLLVILQCPLLLASSFTEQFVDPLDGYRYQLDYLYFDDAVGSDIDYSLTTLSGLNYWRIGDSFRAALRVAGDLANSDELLPPYATPYIQLRGIPAMRYQGQRVVLSEIELTWEINDRWSIDW